MGEKIELVASDGHRLSAYRADPAGAPRGGVVVIHEVWGVNSWVRSVADRYAREGYLAIAPGMFDRMHFGYESEDYSPGYFASIRQMMTGFDADAALLDVAAAVAAAGEAGRVGITGFCFGGRIAWRAAAAGLGLSAASGYYGGGVPDYIDLAPQTPTEMHFGDADKGIPLEQVEALKARHPAVPIYVYAAGHGFCNSDRPENFDEAACRTASARSLALFRQHIG